MIVILSEQECSFCMSPGDTFNLVLNAGSPNEKTIITEVCDKACVIDYAMTFIFTSDNGKAYCNNICGFFGEKDNLPIELRDAVRYYDLAPSQINNLLKTSTVTIRQG